MKIIVTDFITYQVLYFKLSVNYLNITFRN
jgi:hypothetical protein